MMMSIRKNENFLPNVLNEFLDRDWMRKINVPSQGVNIIENEADYRVEVVAPGMTKEDVSICLKDEDRLLVSMEKKAEEREESKDGRYLRKDFSYSKFEQSFVIPENVNKEAISAKVENGILMIDFPKLSEEILKKEDRNIEVK